jgi:simple sugar transport system ATP-binding protein
VSPASTTAPVELRGLTKRFGNVLANAEVSLSVKPGTIHGIIGENGAGKSTAMKMLYGMYRPDAGQIIVNGRSCVWNSPAEAIANGIGMVHQHFMLAGPHTALDNVLLGAEPVRFGKIERRKAKEKVAELADRYGLKVEWERAVEEMPVGLQQRIEIIKLLYRDANLLILDEPTAVLTPQETNNLFANLRRLREQGKTILLVTHKLREVMAFTDRVTVFRAGKVTGELATAQTTPQELANLMVGRKVSLQINVPEPKAPADVAMQVEKLSLAGIPSQRHRLSEVSFSVRHGEIVGIAGVEGNGQSELLQALLHPNDPASRSSGRISLSGQDVSGWTSRRIRELGVAFIPEDRLHEGLLPELPLRENFLLGLHRQRSFNRGSLLDLNGLSEAASAALKEYDVRPNDLNLQAGKLSGGNQQKLIVAREFQRNPRLLIAAQPTRGVDVGAIEFIHKRIVQARDSGAGVLLVSSELEEILALSDRILVMYEGRIAGEFLRGEVSEGELGLKMGGA